MAFLQSLLHICLNISLTQEQFWVKNFKGNLVTPTLHWSPCLSTGAGLFRFHLPTIGHLGQSQPPFSPGSLSHPRSLGLSKGSARPLPQLHISIYSPGPLGFSPVFSHLILSAFPSPLLSRSLLPSASCDYFVPPSK